MRDCCRLQVIATVVLSNGNHCHAALQQYLNLGMHCTIAKTSWMVKSWRVG